MEEGTGYIRPMAATVHSTLQSINLSTPHPAFYLILCLYPSRVSSQPYSLYISKLTYFSLSTCILVGGSIGTMVYIHTSMKNSRQCDDRLNYLVAGGVTAGIWHRIWRVPAKFIPGLALLGCVLGPYI